MSATITIWKVKHPRGEDAACYTISLCKIRAAGHYPVVLDEKRFSMLFPTVDIDKIPEAPNTAELIIVGDLEK